MKTISILIAICLIAVIGTEAGINREKKDDVEPAIESLATFDDGKFIGALRIRRTDDDDDTATKAGEGAAGNATTKSPGGAPPAGAGEKATAAPPKKSGASIVNVSTPILVMVAAMISIINTFKA